jgi:hypothetical protein
MAFRPFDELRVFQIAEHLAVAYLKSIGKKDK